LAFNLFLQIRTYNSGPAQGQPVWSMAGSQGALWQRTNVPLVSAKPFQFIIEGQLEGSDYGIALDDISLTPSCVYYAGSLPPPPTSPPVTITTQRYTLAYILFYG
jgi:hypothetical protein